MNKVLKSGACTCINEPRGDNGLEGYNIDEEYHFEHMSHDKNGKPYYRVYPNKEAFLNRGKGLTYYETCGPTTFKSFFEIK